MVLGMSAYSGADDDLPRCYKLAYDAGSAGRAQSSVADIVVRLASLAERDPWRGKRFSLHANYTPYPALRVMA
jgi:hypothetical protein